MDGKKLTYLYSVLAVFGLCALTTMKTCWNCDRIAFAEKGSDPASWKTMVTMSLPMCLFLCSCMIKTRNTYILGTQLKPKTVPETVAWWHCFTHHPPFHLDIPKVPGSNHFAPFTCAPQTRFNPRFTPKFNPLLKVGSTRI